MNDNLNDMIGENFNVDEVSEDSSPDISEDIIKEPEKSEEIIDLPDIKDPEKSVKLIPLSKWFNDNKQYLVEKSIGYLSLLIKGVDKNESLLFTVPHPEGGKDEKNESRKRLRFFDNSSKVFIPELGPRDFRALNSGFVITQRYNDDISIRNYVFKSGLIITFCCEINNIIVPYKAIKLGKKEANMKIEECDKLTISNKMDLKVDKQSLQLLYKQVEKSVNSINTLAEAITWLNKKQEDVNDLYHLVQIDNTIIEIIK